MAGISQSAGLGGAFMRGANEAIAEKEERDYVKTRRAREEADYGIARELNLGQLEDVRRQRAQQQAYRDAFARGGSWEALSKIAFDSGDVQGYQSFRELRDAAEREGVTKALQMTFGDATPEQIAEAYNSLGTDRVTRVDIKDVKDDKGNVVDKMITAWRGDKPEPTYSRNKAAQLFGLLPKEEYDIKDGYYFPKSGRTPPTKLEGDRFAPSQYVHTLKETGPDGVTRERLIDLRTFEDVTPGGKRIEAGALSHQVAKAISDEVSSLYKAQGMTDLEGVRPQMSRAIGIATQLYRNGAVDAQGRTLTPAEVASIAIEVTDGRLKPEDALKYLPKQGQKTSGQQQEQPPIAGAQKAQDGNWYVQQGGEWFKVIPSASAAAPAAQRPAAQVPASPFGNAPQTAGIGQPQDVEAVPMAPSLPPQSMEPAEGSEPVRTNVVPRGIDRLPEPRVPVVGGIMDAAKGVGSMLSGREPAAPQPGIGRAPGPYSEEQLRTLQLDKLRGERAVEPPRPGVGIQPVSRTPEPKPNDRSAQPGIAPRAAPQKFDPEGEGYDYEGAERAGLKPNETGHWPSRDPKSGRILKGRKHETYGKTEEEEKRLGNAITKGQDGRYYSNPAKKPQQAAKPSKPAKEPHYRAPESFGQHEPYTDYLRSVAGYLKSPEVARRLGSGDAGWFEKWMPWLYQLDRERAVKIVRAFNDTIRSGRSDGNWAQLRGRVYDLDREGRMVVVGKGK